MGFNYLVWGLIILFGVYLELGYLGVLSVLLFVEVDVSVNGSKHCKLPRISLRYASKGDFGTALGKRENAMRSR